jgi:hypothetical protein
MEDDIEDISLPAGTKSQKSIDDVVAEVLDAEVEKGIVRHDAPVPREGEGGPLAWIGLLVLTLLSAYLWLAPPAFLDAPIPEPPESLLEAGIRMEMAFQALKVERFLQREGRLPNSLAEAGGPFSSVSYHRLDSDRYQLSLPGLEGRVTYSSVDPMEDFLGNSAAVIREGGL